MKTLVPLISLRESGKFIELLTKKDTVYLALVISQKKLGRIKFKLFFNRLEQMKQNLVRLQKQLEEKGIRSRELILWGDTVSELKNIIHARNIEKIIIKKQNKSISTKLRRYCKVVMI
jgi:hypothetical protein